MEYRAKRKQSGAKMELNGKNQTKRRSPAQKSRGAMIFAEEGQFLCTAARQEEPQHRAQVPQHYSRIRNARFHKRRGAIKKTRGAMMSASAKKLKFDLIHSKLR